MSEGEPKTGSDCKPIDVSALTHQDKLFFAARSKRAQAATELLYDGTTDKLPRALVIAAGEDMPNLLYFETIQEWGLSHKDFHELAEESYQFLRRPKEDDEA